MTTAQRVHRSVVSLKLARSVPAFISQAKAMVQAMTGNPSFPNPEPPLATVSTAIHDLEVAENAAQSRAHGAATTRNDKRAALVFLLEQLKGHVQKVADGNLETGAAVIQSAGVGVRKQVVRAKRVFSIKPGAVAGTVKVITAAADRRASYDWEYSTDGSKTWIALPSTLKASTSLGGLTPGATVTFRYRAITKVGVGDWSLPTSMMVQ
jgi:hypothetical protein